MDDMRLLVLHYEPISGAPQRHTVGQHLRALEQSRYRVSVSYYNACIDCPDPLRQDRQLRTPEHLRNERFHAVILHYTFLAFHWDALALLKWKHAFQWVADLPCLKMAMPQDEADHADLLDEWLFDWGVESVFSVLDRPGAGLYRQTRRYAEIIPCLTGYIDERTTHEMSHRLRPLEKRGRDLVYRARNLPFRFGTAGRMKAEIGERMAGPAAEAGFRADISTRDEDAVLGPSWMDFLASSKATLGCESGYTVVDPRGEIKAREAELLASIPYLSYDEFADRMPKGWDSHHLFTVSPRHFEAIETKTCQILLEGAYAQILEPDRHYIPLKQDFSNVPEVFYKLRDTAYLNEITQTAYDDIVSRGDYAYGKFADLVCGTVAKRLAGGIAKESSEGTRQAERRAIAERHRASLAELQLNQRVPVWRGYRGQLEAQLAALATAVDEYRNACVVIEESLPAAAPPNTDGVSANALRRRLDEFRSRLQGLEAFGRELAREHAASENCSTLDEIECLIERYRDRLTRLTQERDDLSKYRAGLIREYMAVTAVAAADAAEAAILTHHAACEFIDRDIASIAATFADGDRLARLTSQLGEFRTQISSFQSLSRRTGAEMRQLSEPADQEGVERQIEQCRYRLTELTRLGDEVGALKGKLSTEHQTVMAIADAEQLTRSKLNLLESYCAELSRLTSGSAAQILEWRNQCEYIHRDITEIPADFSSQDRLAALEGQLTKVRAELQDFEAKASEVLAGRPEADAATDPDRIEGLMEDCRGRLDWLGQASDGMAQMAAALLTEYRAIMAMADKESRQKAKWSSLQSYRAELDRIRSTVEAALREHEQTCEYIEQDVRSLPRRTAVDLRSKDLLGAVARFKVMIAEFASQARQWSQNAPSDKLASSPDALSLDAMDRLIGEYCAQVSAMDAKIDRMNTDRAGLIESWRSIMGTAATESANE